MRVMSQNNPSRLHRFRAELSRRHVVRVGLGYAAVLFVVLQLSEIILPAFLRNAQSDEVLRMLVVGGVLLFPIVLAMAWIYEVTPQGIRSMAELDAEAGIPEHGAMLPRLAFLGVTVLAASAAGLWWWQSADPIQSNTGFTRPSSFQAATTLDASGPIRSIAVLPLEDQSAQEGDEYFAASMHEAVVSQISQNSSLRVISRTTVLRYDQRGKSLTQMGAELGVDAIVEGSVLLVEGRVRVTVQLIHAASDTHLWAQDYTRNLTDIIALQRDVATAIASEIGMQVLSREPGMGERVATNDLTPAIGAPEIGAPAQTAPNEVQLSTMRGRFMLQGRTPEEYSAAEDYFTEALARDPDFAPALTGLAGAHLFQGLDNGVESERLTELVMARDNAQRALQIDPENQEALEIVYSVDDALSDFATRAGDIGLAIAASAGAATGFQIRTLDSLGIVTMAGDTVLFQTSGTRPVSTELGRLVQERMGLSAIQDGHEVGSADHMRDQWTASLRLASAGRLEQATQVLVQASTTGDADWKMWELREQLQRAQGDFEAVVATRRARREQLGREPGPSANALTRDVEARGLQGYWQWKQAEYEARQNDGSPVLHTYQAAAAAGLGQSESAISALRQAIRERESVLAALRVDPVWDNLRSDTRFQNLLSEIRVRVQRDGRTPDGPSR